MGLDGSLALALYTLYASTHPHTISRDLDLREAECSANAVNSQAIPQVHVERILHQRTPIARFESQRNGLQGPKSVFLGGDVTANER